MKNKLLISALVALAAVTGVSAQGNSSGNSPTIIVESENARLAQDFVRAFGTLVRPPFTMTLQRENVRYTLEDVRSLKDSGGMLVVEVGRGFKYIVNPRDIVAIADGPEIRGER